MKFRFASAAAAILALSLVASYATAQDTNPPVKKHTATPKADEKARKPKPPTVQEQIQAAAPANSKGRSTSLKPTWPPKTPS